MLKPRTLVTIALALALAVLWWAARRPPSTPVTSLTLSTGVPTLGERTMLDGCNPPPAPPPLPPTLTPSAPSVEAVVQALNATLSDDHKAFLRCFPDEDDLVARVHSGLGRWLRNTLHLFSDNPLTASLRSAGVSNADQMSSVILRAYARSLNGQPLDIPNAVARSKAPVESPEQP